MLEEINISNFAIIDEQTVPFIPGFNVMSGETGAGKSILIDALGLQLGDRADNNWIRLGRNRCNIQSSYRFPSDSAIQQWLYDNEFDEEMGQCQLRRTLSDNGKSKCYINGLPTTVANTKKLGEMLVDIHGQHAHQSLMHTDKQLTLLDQFANHPHLLNKVSFTYKIWQQLLKQQKQLQNNDDNLEDRRDLLLYQLAELEQLSPTADEFQALSNEQKRLSAANDILTQVNTIEVLLDGDNSISSTLNHLIHAVADVTTLDNRADSISDFFNQSLIYLDEGRTALRQYTQTIELDPVRLADVEQRMSDLHKLARKHKVQPEELPALQVNLQQQLDGLELTLESLDQIDADISKAASDYHTQAQILSDSRRKAAKRLCRRVDEKLALLNLENARFSIEFSDHTTVKSSGIDHILFLFAPNPGQGEKPLHKIASGGELSRISLAIQVASINAKTHSTLIFDEVDSGIGGATAEVVGRLLKTLSQYHQIICVTHLAQVAAFADQHIEISKSIQNGETFTQFHLLDEKKRIVELARMSGGINPDKKTQEHAKKLRDNAVQFTQTLK